MSKLVKKVKQRVKRAKKPMTVAGLRKKINKIAEGLKGGKNVDLLRKVAKLIRESKTKKGPRAVGYDQGQWCRATRGAVGVRRPECGTNACIAGWTLLALGAPRKTAARAPVSELAREALGLGLLEASALFTGAAWQDWPVKYRPAHAMPATETKAAKLLEDLADGKVKL